MDIFKLGDKILALLEAVFGFWNNQISLVFAMLGQSPVSFKGGGPWAVIEGIEPIFVAVGSSLVRQVETMRTLLTQSLAVLMPFNVQELNDSTGNYYGINQISKNVNIGNRKKLINGNGFVFGVPGSGKSFFCKMEMGSVFLSGDDEIIVIDPMNEYFDIAETYGGTVVNMSTYTDNYVNPLEMDVWSLDPNDSKGMVREKGEFMLGLCEQCMESSHNRLLVRCLKSMPHVHMKSVMRFRRIFMRIRYDMLKHHIGLKMV